MRLSLLLLPLAVAGCAALTGNPVPREVRLSDTAMTMTLTDGTLCRLKNWQARPVGRFESCGPGFGYAITVEGQPNPLRAALEDIGGAVSGNLLAPMAQIVITDPAGYDHAFSSPVPFRSTGD